MDNLLKESIWKQFGASIDMLENAVNACPEDLWGDGTKQPEFWYLTYHTLFWLDCYLSERPEGFIPPDPFTLVEMDPAGLYPERVYSKDELLRYLEHGRKKCQLRIQALTDENVNQRSKFFTLDLNYFEMLLYIMRHVQHHTAQLNLLLRQKTDSAPKWVRQAQKSL